jgi:hypothetical protein
LPKISENILPSTRRTLFRTGPTGQTPYQILVLTAVSPVRPSPSLQRHAAHCNDIPDTVGAHGDGTSPCLPLCLVGTPLTAPSNQSAGGGRTVNLYTATLEAAPVWAQDAPRRHGWTRFARTAVNSVELLAMPSHVGE